MQVIRLLCVSLLVRLSAIKLECAREGLSCHTYRISTGMDLIYRDRYEVAARPAIKKNLADLLWSRGEPLFNRSLAINNEIIVFSKDESNKFPAIRLL